MNWIIVPKEDFNDINNSFNSRNSVKLIHNGLMKNGDNVYIYQPKSEKRIVCKTIVIETRKVKGPSDSEFCIRIPYKRSEEKIHSSQLIIEEILDNQLLNFSLLYRKGFYNANAGAHIISGPLLKYIELVVKGDYTIETRENEFKLWMRKYGGMKKSSTDTYLSAFRNIRKINETEQLCSMNIIYYGDYKEVHRIRASLNRNEKYISDNEIRNGTLDGVIEKYIEFLKDETIKIKNVNEKQLRIDFNEWLLDYISNTGRNLSKNTINQYLSALDRIFFTFGDLRTLFNTVYKYDTSKSFRDLNSKVRSNRYFDFINLKMSNGSLSAVLNLYSVFLLEKECGENQI